MAEALMGTMAWCELRGGRLTEAEKSELARGVAALRAEMSFDDLRHRLGLLRPAPIDLDALAPPDSKLVRDATEFGREIYDDVLWRHCLRTYYFGALIAAYDGLAFDREVLYAAALCHDAGLNEAVAGPLSACCFAHGGGRVSRERLLACGHAPEVADRVADAVSTHLNLHVPAGLYPAESALTAAGAVCDVLGARARRIAPETLARLVERWPRAGMADALARAAASRHPADTRPALLLQMGAFEGGGTHPIEAALGEPRAAPAGAGGRPPSYERLREKMAAPGLPDVTVAILIGPGFLPMDMIGGQSVFGTAPSARVLLVAKSDGLVEGFPNWWTKPNATFATCPEEVDVLIVPMLPPEVQNDPEVIAFVADRGRRARYVLGVCNGVLLLGAAGLLQGKRVTASYNAIAALPDLGAREVVPPGSGVAVDGNLYTAGPSVGSIEGSLLIFERIFGRALAEFVELVHEYDPRPPFGTGAPERAGPERLAQFEALMSEVTAEYRAGATAALRARGGRPPQGGEGLGQSQHFRVLAKRRAAPPPPWRPASKRLPRSDNPAKAPRMPSLFSEFSLKGVTLKNRIVVSPMCQYSAENGVPNQWHAVHLGARAVGGAGLVIAEATAVAPEGRITPGCTGLWADAQADAFAPIVAFVKRYAVPGIQLAHAGRKAAANRPWEGDDHMAPGDARAWQPIGPSPVAFGANLPRAPHEMTEAEIARVRADFVASAKRALAAGFEWLELHFAHGYLGQSFFSPIANKRTDRYGGSFENRARFLVETLAAVREVWPERLPLTARLGVSDFNAEGQPLEESIELVRRFKAHGLDLIDVSLGFNTPDLSGVPWGPGFMAPFAERVRREAEIATAVGWFIREPQQAQDIVANGQADLVMLAHAELDDPHWPYHAAKALDVADPHAVLPPQYAYWLKRR
ncbi:MAG TPA: DJ-1/PfpI family protein [Polyangiaceae bacterium]|nr:DJ-1/PfpI family protein [Polyangiaceae bacterium]